MDFSTKKSEMFYSFCMECTVQPGFLLSEKGTRGVGMAANSSVVTAMFLIFIEEVIIVQIINWFR